MLPAYVLTLCIQLPDKTNHRPCRRHRRQHSRIYRWPLIVAEYIQRRSDGATESSTSAPRARSAIRAEGALSVFLVRAGIQVVRRSIRKTNRDCNGDHGRQPPCGPRPTRGKHDLSPLGAPKIPTSADGKYDADRSCAPPRIGLRGASTPLAPISARLAAIHM